MSNKNDLAFPLVLRSDAINVGLTKREYLSGLAMQGLLSCDGNVRGEAMANYAVECADALLERLEK